MALNRQLTDDEQKQLDQQLEELDRQAEHWPGGRDSDLYADAKKQVIDRFYQSVSANQSLDDSNLKYGGSAGAADEFKGLQRKLGMDAQNRQGVQVDYGQADYDRDRARDARNYGQVDMAALMRARAEGKVPSIAQMQADRQMGQAAAAQTSAAASARGPAALALAQQNAAGNTAATQSAISNQAQINAANERLQAEQAAMGAYSTIRQGDQAAQSQDAQQQQYQAGLSAQQRQLNDQMTQSMLQGEHAVNVTQAQINENIAAAKAGREQQRLEMQWRNDEARRQANAGVFSALTSGFGSMMTAGTSGLAQGAASAAGGGDDGGGPSDERAKVPITWGTPEMYGETKPQVTWGTPEMYAQTPPTVAEAEKDADESVDKTAPRMSAEDDRRWLDLIGRNKEKGDKSDEKERKERAAAGLKFGGAVLSGMGGIIGRALAGPPRPRPYVYVPPMQQITSDERAKSVTMGKLMKGRLLSDENAKQPVKGETEEQRKAREAEEERVFNEYMKKSGNVGKTAADFAKPLTDEEVADLRDIKAKDEFNQREAARQAQREAEAQEKADRVAYYDRKVPQQDNKPEWYRNYPILRALKSPQLTDDEKAAAAPQVREREQSVRDARAWYRNLFGKSYGDWAERNSPKFAPQPATVRQPESFVRERPVTSGMETKDAQPYVTSGLEAKTAMPYSDERAKTPVSPGLAKLLSISDEERKAMAEGRDVPATDNGQSYLYAPEGHTLNANDKGSWLSSTAPPPKENEGPSLSGPTPRYSRSAPREPAPVAAKAAPPRKLSNDELRAMGEAMLAKTEGQRDAQLSAGPSTHDSAMREYAAPPEVEEDAARRLRGHPYRYKEGFGEDTSQVHYGPNAQELEKNPITATAVVRGPDGVRRLDPAGLHRVEMSTIGANQEQLDEHDDRLARLESFMGQRLAAGGRRR